MSVRKRAWRGGPAVWYLAAAFTICAASAFADSRRSAGVAPPAGTESSPPKSLTAWLGSVGDTGGLSLAEATDIALKSNHDLRLAIKKAAAAGYDTDAARSLFFPQVSAEYGYDVRDREVEQEFGGQAVPLGEKEFQRGEIAARMTLWDFGRTLGAYRQAAGAEEAAAQVLQRVRQDVIYRTETAYFAVLETRRFRQVARAAVRQARDHLKTAESQYRNGVVTTSDVLRARANLARARQELIRADNAVSISESRFNNVLGVDIDRSVCIRDEEAHSRGLLSEGVREAFRCALRTAAENRPELKQMAALIRSARGGLMSSRGRFLPAIYISGKVDHLDDKYQVHKTTALAEIGLRIDLFTGGRDLAGWRKARVNVERAEEQAAKLLDLITLEVKQAVLYLDEALQKLDVAAAAAAYADSNLTLVNNMYGEGAATSTDVMDAELLRTSAFNDYVSALYDLQVAESRLRYATGVIGWGTVRQVVERQEEKR